MLQSYLKTHHVNNRAHKFQNTCNNKGKQLKGKVRKGMHLKFHNKMERTPVGAESHKHVLETCTVHGDPTVCSCRHNKTSACVRSMYCVWRLYCVQL